MNFQKINAFLMLATTLNYTKASDLLYMTQPNLSKMITSLEQDIGVTLLERNKRTVKLTPAGQMLFHEMNKTMSHYNSSILKAKLVQSGISGIIHLGFLGSAMMHKLPQIICKFQSTYPDIQLKLTDYTYPQLIDALDNFEIDLAFLPDYELEKISKLSKKTIYTDKMCMVVNQSHKYANRSHITIDLFAEEHFVVIDPKVSTRDYSLISNICIENNFFPTISYKVNTLNSVMLMIECGMGVSILAKHMQRYASENVKFIELEGYETFFTVSCAWKATTNPCIQKFLTIL
ncbi:MAG: LysR family transcriptional regulator [Lachnospiraceae bacterium]